MKIKGPRITMFIKRGFCICGMVAALSAAIYGVDYLTANVLLPLILI